MFATCPVVQLYCRNYPAFYHNTVYLTYVLEEHLLDIMDAIDVPLLKLMLQDEKDIASRMISMYGFCTTPLCKALKRLMCALLVRRVRDPLHILALWGEKPGQSHAYDGPFPIHVMFADDLKKARYIFHDLTLPSVDLAWLVRIELHARSKTQALDHLCWAKSIQSVKVALRMACKGSKPDMVTLSRFIRQEVRHAGKIMRYQKLTPAKPLDIQAEYGMTNLESGHPAHNNAFRQIKSLLSRIPTSTLQLRMNSVCTALVDFARIQQWPKQNSKPRLELYWTIRHLMIVRSRGLFDPVEIEESMEIAEQISRNESDPLKRLRVLTGAL